MEAIEPAMPVPQESPSLDTGRPRVHLVVVLTREIAASDTAAPGRTLRTRFWHPRDRRWSENEFE